MTTEEAIKWFQSKVYDYLEPDKRCVYNMAIAALRAQQEKTNQHPCINCGVGWGSANESGVTSCMETCEKLAAYMAQQEREDPKPLTLDELREMDGEPVWAEMPNEYKSYNGWAIVGVTWKLRRMIYLYRTCGVIKIYPGLLHNGCKVYRHKPMED